MRFYLLLLLLLCAACGVKSPLAPQAENTPDTVAPAQDYAPAETEPGWESSGGGGVACFETNERALEAKIALESKGKLPRELVDQIASLVTLEYWEAKELHFQNLEGKNREEIRAEVSNLLKTHSPIFFSRLRLVTNKIPRSAWIEGNGLPLIEDRTATLAPNCVLVQLAVRRTRSTPGKLPQAEVGYDPELVAKLDSINQTLLEFHEEMYLIGRETGHFTSDDLRPVVARLFSDELSNLLKKQKHPSDAGRIVQLLLGRIYGDYYRFFVEDEADRPATVQAGYHPYSRYLSFGRLLTLLRERLGKCMRENGFGEIVKKPTQKQIKIHRACSDFAMNPVEVGEIVNEEQAFLYLTRWWLPPKHVIDNAENLVVWEAASPFIESDYQILELQRACDFLGTAASYNHGSLITAARSYCAEIKKSWVRL